MNKIEVGEYIRTKNGLIFKVDEEKKNIDINEFLNMGGNRDIKAHSKNIIDLIEEGDYVNGRKVYQVGYNFQDYFVLKMSESNYEDFIYPEDIKTIVTKEQFKEMEYRINE